MTEVCCGCRDLVRLGFITVGSERVAEEAGVAQVLASVYSKLAGGGAHTPSPTVAN